jgi:ethanolamine ammonia-lyase large subunit
MGLLGQKGDKLVNRERAIEIARESAKANPQGYYSEPFQPHEWVVDAILAGAKDGAIYGIGDKVIGHNGETLTVRDVVVSFSYMLDDYSKPFKPDEIRRKATIKESSL